MADVNDHGMSQDLYEIAQSQPNMYLLPEAPYPGLRPFLKHESSIFFGRERQVGELLNRLSGAHFIAVLGPSGCGKSSLVRAGVIPKLESGVMPDTQGRWRTVTMKPGNSPMRSLASSLVRALEPDVSSDTELITEYRSTLSRGSDWLIQLAKRKLEPLDSDLLIVVDQFEELFRIDPLGGEREAHEFVSLLVRVSEATPRQLYVMITMRSDYLSDATRFMGLPDALNRSQYLTPRLNEADLRDAIESPAILFDGEVASELTDRILQDMGPDPDELPLMQHTLMRIWTTRVDSHREPVAPVLTLHDYEAVGGLAMALSRHCDDVMKTLNDEQKSIAEIMFRRLSTLGRDRRMNRSPARLDEVAAIARVDSLAVKPVVEAFRRSDRCFLTPTANTPIEADTVLDVSHESLIRQWSTVTIWVEAEFESSDIYRRLAESARRCVEIGAGLYSGVNLAEALNWRMQEHPSVAWAVRYGGGFHQTMEFLDASEKKESERKRREREAQQRELRQAYLTGGSLGRHCCNSGLRVVPAWHNRRKE